MSVVVYLVDPAGWTELLGVIAPLSRPTTTSPAELRAAIDAGNAYYERHRFPWNRGPDEPNASLADLTWRASTFATMLAHSGVMEIRARDIEPLPIGAASVMHAYARAITGEPNVAPVHGQSTQIVMGEYSWLTADQVAALAARGLATLVPTRDRLRAERRRLQYPHETDEQIDAAILGLARYWIRVAELVEEAARRTLAYLAHDEPPDTE